MSSVSLQDIHALQWTRYSEIASTAIIFYDFLITIGMEWRLIWPSRFSYPKFLFLFIRYYTLAVAILNTYFVFNPSVTARICHAWVIWQTVTGFILFLSTEMTLQLRLYGMYECSKKILSLMIFFFTLSGLSALTVLILNDISIKAAAFDAGPYGKFCRITFISHFYYAYWIPFICFEALLFGLAVFKGYQTIMKDQTNFSIRPIMKSLVKDSILYFTVVFAAYLTNAVIAFTGIKPLLEIPIGFSVAMSTVMSQRLLLNVRDRSHIYAGDTVLLPPGLTLSFANPNDTDWSDTEAWYTPDTSPTSPYERRNPVQGTNSSNPNLQNLNIEVDLNGDRERKRDKGRVSSSFSFSEHATTTAATSAPILNSTEIIELQPRSPNSLSPDSAVSGGASEPSGSGCGSHDAVHVMGSFSEHHVGEAVEQV